MKREDAKELLTKLRTLARDGDFIIDTFILLAEIEARAEIGSTEASQEFIDDMILNKSLLKLTSQLIDIQSKLIAENEKMIKAQSNKIEAQNKTIIELKNLIETMKSDYN